MVRRSWCIGSACGVLALAALGWLAGGEPSGPGRPAVAERPAPPSPTPEAAALAAVLDRLGPAEGALVHGLRVVRFGPPDQLAVCGRWRVPDPAEPDASFVARVLLPDGAAGRLRPLVVLEEGPGLPRFRDHPARGRYCGEGVPMPAIAAPPVPPPATGAEERGLAAADGGGGPPRAGAVTRSPANLREVPGGAVIRTAPRGESFRLHGQAPGGWMQVGGPEGPQGWIHSSLLDMPAR